MKRGMICIVLLALLLGISAPAGAEETAVEITTVEELLNMQPSGSYILMNDLDMAGIKWTPLDFSGTFDGNGHAILNLTISGVSSTTSATWDGNRKEYETSFAGMFGLANGAEIRNLQLLNLRAVITSDSPCFVGGLIGYGEDCTVTGCTIAGTLELQAHDRMFGIGGVVGYGSGRVEDCQVDVTLICVDTDAENVDEQFMGGVYAAGFMDVIGCTVAIDGYASEHGYAHNGGIVGMYAEYPLGVGQRGYINNNSVTGKISFFEDCPSRRAYCSAYVGEAMVNLYYLDGNTQDFLRDERTDYTVELRPEMCASPGYTQVLIPGTCDSYGYTEFTCQECGYTYRDSYTLFQHTVTSWTVTISPTQEQEGEQQGICDQCGTVVTQVLGMLEVQPTQTEQTQAVLPTETEFTPAPQAEEGEQGGNGLYIALAADGALLLLALLLWRKLRKNRQK